MPVLAVVRPPNDLDRVSLSQRTGGSLLCAAARARRPERLPLCARDHRNFKNSFKKLAADSGALGRDGDTLLDEGDSKHQLK
jgi:hypothetical protein